MRIYNSLTQKVEDFKPQHEDLVTMYTCGPTVYKDIHIGNFRTFVLADFLYRVLQMNGYKVQYVTSITDVGHLTLDTGEDRVEAAAREQNKSALDITTQYIKEFYEDCNKLNIKKPTKYTKASDYIDDQIELIAKLEELDFTYKTSDGIYFDTSKVDNYGELSGLTIENIKEDNSNDFALWKYSLPGLLRFQEWHSPWGDGFPGWHTECAAMCLSELGETIDFHLGGEDLKKIHHPNEIAQCEAVTGKDFVKYWVHVSLLNIEKDKMSKSLGNFITLQDIEKKDFHPLHFRYLLMTTHYRETLSFSWDSLQNARSTLKRLYDILGSYVTDKEEKPNEKYLSMFKEKVNDDLNMPEAVAVVWNIIKSDLEESVKLATILEIDKVLGLKIEEKIGFEVPSEVLTLAKLRKDYRDFGIWDKADVIRKEIISKGYVIEDLPDNEFKLKRKF